MAAVKNPKKSKKISTVEKKYVNEVYQADKCDATILLLQDELKIFKNEETFICLQDCLKKLMRIRVDNGN